MTKKYVFTGAIATLKALRTSDIREIRHGMETIPLLDLEEMARLEQREIEHERRQGL